MYLKNCPLTRGEAFDKCRRGTNRTLPVEVMEARADAVLDRVPITRVSEISRLIGSDLPVFAATTPLARDLTTHMGKGLTPQAARISAIMEGVERVSAERVHAPFRRCSRVELLRIGEHCADPERFDLPPDSRYRPDVSIAWVQAWEMIEGREIWIPADLCRSPPKEGLLTQVDTNGLASGATRGEAILHALLEVIERDAVSQHLFFDIYGGDDRDPPARRAIASQTLPPGCADYLGRLSEGGVSIALTEISTDIRVPVVECTIADAAYPSAAGVVCMTFGGWGCDPVMEHAVNRALTEAHQARIGTIQSARDSFNLIERRSPLRPAPDPGPDEQSFGRGPPVQPSDSIAEDVDAILRRLREVGVDQAIVADMTDPAIGLPVVRVRVPDLSVFVVDRARVGWRCMRHLV
ncbi:YcaO-like family protein [Jhaorihella thermophila]|uniref:Ribosomal protein S12 methylthiotransferase accessory factor n=1 Tax=Jhaorihella thermophila TaxID=488547 RepID=A0A1H5UKA4_9RHOB|nr:YcaO-like family protein [Jhaorihella thermophila]SEF75462.1 ribosomal protein S12 methylthiotransferase accessory factor [Jhaorihella thermophila]